MAVRYRISALIGAVLLMVPGGAQAARDELVIGMSQFPTTFLPGVEASTAKSYVLDMTRRPFTTYDKDWNLVCMLCTEMPSIENGLATPEKTPEGKQGIAVTYTIQPDATWGDGVPVTTEDVMFTWKVGREPQSGISNMELYRTIYAIDAKDDKTFTLHFDKLTHEYAAINDFLLLPAHVEADAFRDPAEYKHRTAFDTDTLNEGLYFGPYLISDIKTGAYIVLEPNPTWWGAKPHFKRIVVKVVENTAALEANLLAGDIDMIAGELGLTIDQALALEKRYGNRFDFIFKPGLIYEHVEFNLDNPILADKRVRQALVYALDRQAISQQLFGGRQPVAHSDVSPLDWVYAEDVKRYDHDPKRAVKLLAEAGWSHVRQGVRHNDQGEPLRLEIMTTAGDRTRELVEQVLQSQWKRVGVDVRIRNQPARVLFGQTLSQRKFPAMALFAWMSSPENLPRTTLHSAHIPSAGNNYAGQNYTGFRNAEMDRILEEAEVTLEKEKRRALWHRLQEIYAEELPSIPLYFRANSFVLPKWLKGVEPTGHQYPTTLWVENWRAE